MLEVRPKGLRAVCLALAARRLDKESVHTYELAVVEAEDPITGSAYPCPRCFVADDEFHGLLYPLPSVINAGRAICRNCGQIVAFTP